MTNIGKRIETAPAAKEFMLAGKAVITFKSLKTGEHLTYKITAAKQPGKVSHFVKVRTGGTGKNAFEYLGFITANGFVHANKSIFLQTAVQSRAFRFAAAKLMAGTIPVDLEVWHEGQCGRCARPLTKPESIESGFGPECIGKISCMAA